MGVPVRKQQFKTADFASFLARHGAEICTPTNGYEVIRYRAFWEGSAKALTHIVYAKESGLLTYTGASREHYEAFIAGEALPDTAATLDDKRARRLKGTAGVRVKLRQRDGDCCWYCGGLLESAESNVEHLINISDGGTNALANLVLTHTTCNTAAGNKPLAEKMDLRARLRSAAQIGGPQ